MVTKNKAPRPEPPGRDPVKDRAGRNDTERTADDFVESLPDREDDSAIDAERLPDDGSADIERDTGDASDSVE